MPDQEQRDKALNKIKKLLALARDGRGDPTEAETALRQAQSLMARYNIDEAEAIKRDLDDPNAESIIASWAGQGLDTGTGKPRKEIPPWLGVLSYGVSILCECQAMIHNFRAPNGEVLGKAIVFGGYKMDVIVAVWTLDYLIDCVRRRSNEFEKAVLTKNPNKLLEFSLHLSYEDMRELLSETPKVRGSRFRRTMSATLQARMVTLRKETDASIKAETEYTGRGTALVVIDQKALAVEKRFPTLKTGTVSLKTSLASLAGRNEGLKVNIKPGPVECSPASPSPLLRQRG